MSTPTDRKPSGSSTTSRANSPLQSPGHASQRKVTSGTQFIGTRMGTAPAMKTLSPDWQVWGNTASTTRDTVAGRPEPSQAEGGYLGDSWHSSHRLSGQWEDAGTTGQRTDVQPQLALHHTRQRQTSGGPHSPLTDSAMGVSKGGRYTQHRYSVLPRDRVDTSVYTSSTPSRSVPLRTGSPFAAQHQAPPASGAIGPYDPVATSAAIEEKLSITLRGMAVEDEYGLVQHQNHRPPALQIANTPDQPHLAPTRAAQVHHLQQTTAPHPPFPQPDFSSYYNVPRMDYPYAFDTYRAPDPMYSSPALSAANAASLAYSGMSSRGLPQSMPEVHAMQSAIFYDFASQSRPAFYYPAQHIAFQHSHPPPPSGTSPSFNKKRPVPLSMQHQRPPPGSPYHGVSSSPMLGSHPPFLPIDYSTHMPMLSPSHPMFPQGEVSSPIQYVGRGRRLEHPNTYRSPLLEEFRNSRIRTWELKDLYGHIVEFSTDQQGSRFIQKALEVATEDEKRLIFDEVVPQHALQLTQDVFGNYVIQYYLEHGTIIQKATLMNCMQGHILPLALQMYGCRVVQKAVECVTPDQQSMIVRELEENVLQCVKDANGNHVIQRLIQGVEPERLTFIKYFLGHVQELATHPYGCRVLQRCFEHMTDAHTLPLVDELQRYAIRLMQDQFGNYVIQFVLEHGQDQYRKAIIAQLRGRMLQMSRHKFASNVCEKALVSADHETRRLLIEEMMRTRQDGSSPLVTMMRDQYANYVLQRALVVADVEQKVALIEKMKPHLVQMRKRANQSRHLIAIERLLAKCATEHTILPSDVHPIAHLEEDGPPSSSRED